MVVSFLILSFGAQALAAWLSLRLALTTRRGAWLLLFVAMLLMAFRRGFALYDTLAFGGKIAFTSECIGLLVSVSLLMGLAGVYRKTLQRPARDEEALLSDRSQSLRHLSRTAVLLGALTSVGSCLVGYWAYGASRNAILKGQYESNLSLARTLASAAEHLGQGGSRP